ncbi:hypothetical protein EST38_g172 [Candolleomyces aberdarensis]|uniref:Uncharacterized protein n=1 Tax=Candolleomyces aberdarensis TaxID=2316362 RepID=A0A4Q2E1E2_9AGAR|nr:hypothetical protein EST38_g172 [Candolleomyces aberdarensis]
MPSVRSAASFVKKISRGYPLDGSSARKKTLSQRVISSTMARPSVSEKPLANEESKAPLPALQNAIVVTDILFSIAETIPVIGTPIKGALEAVCKVLRVVEQRFEVKEDIDELIDKLSELLELLSKEQDASNYLPRLLRYV